jgi:hypothetical protein
VLINGVTVTVKVAHVRLCHSRMLFVRAYPRETQEMVFDAHNRAFAFFKGACTRGIYDNMKTAVEAVFIGKDRQFNRRFLRMCGHYLVEPTACTPASGWEKGQVENQVGVVRERFFTPRLRVASYEELNAWLLDRCVAYAKAHKHPELSNPTIWQAFEFQIAILDPAQAHRLFEDRVEHRREVAGRGLDDAEHLGGRGLLLQGLARLGQQARVLHRGDRLCRKILEQRDLLVGEGAHFGPVHDEDAYQRIILAQRDPQCRARACHFGEQAARRNPGSVNRVVGNVRRVDECRPCRAPSGPPSSWARSSLSWPS